LFRPLNLRILLLLGLTKQIWVK